MSIDRIGKGRIGKGPPPKPAGAASEAERARGTEPSKPFELRPEAAQGGAGATSAAAAPGPTGAGALEQLRRGEVDLDGYLDLKVREATAHLKGLRPAELEGIRAALREHVTGDPALAEIVRRATGELPRAKE